MKTWNDLKKDADLIYIAEIKKKSRDGVTQEDAATDLGISPSTLRKFLSNRGLNYRVLGREREAGKAGELFRDAGKTGLTLDDVCNKMGLENDGARELIEALTEAKVIYRDVSCVVPIWVAV